MRTMMAITVGLGLALALVARGQVPLRKAYLQDGLNGNGKPATNFLEVQGQLFRGNGGGLTNLSYDSITNAPSTLGLTTNDVNGILSTNLVAGTRVTGTLTNPTTGTAAGLIGVVNPTNLPPGLASSNYVGTFTGNANGVSNVPMTALPSALVTNGQNLANVIVTNPSISGVMTNLSGSVQTGGFKNTNYATGNWVACSNGAFHAGTITATNAIIDGTTGNISGSGQFAGNAAGLTNFPSNVVTTNQSNPVILATSCTASGLTNSNSGGRIYSAGEIRANGTIYSTRFSSSGDYFGVGITNSGNVALTNAARLLHVAGSAVIGNALTVSNAMMLPQLASIPTNSIPDTSTSSSATNWYLVNVGGVPTLVATNYAAGGWLQKGLWP